VIWICPVTWCMTVICNCLCYCSDCLQAVESSLNDLCDLLCCAEEYCNHSCHWVGMCASTSRSVNVDYSVDTNRWDSDAIVSASATAWIAVNLTRLFGNYLIVQGDIICFVIQVWRQEWKTYHHKPNRKPKPQLRSECVKIGHKCYVICNNETATWSAKG
jgi:hypothetical protein